MLEFFLNNQPDAPIIKIYSVIKLYMFSGIFSAHYQNFSTVHSALVSFMQIFYGRFQAESGWNSVPSWHVEFYNRINLDNWFHPDSVWKRSSKTCMKPTSS
jgi:hypothetical protein